MGALCATTAEGEVEDMGRASGFSSCGSSFECVGAIWKPLQLTAGLSPGHLM